MWPNNTDKQEFSNYWQTTLNIKAVLKNWISKEMTNSRIAWINCLNIKWNIVEWHWCSMKQYQVIQNGRMYNEINEQGRQDTIKTPRTL